MTELNWENLHREVYCFNCKEYSFTDQPIPLCKCGKKLYTVCKSIITGEKLTGAVDSILELPSIQNVD